MMKVAPVAASLPDVLKALSDEMRWSIVVQMAEVDELACTKLEHTLPVSKPTISYHIKVLYHAGLIEVRKEGRNYYYRLRRDVLNAVLGDVVQELGLPGVPAEPDRADRPARSTVATANPARAGSSARVRRAASAASSG